jgi:hypothetical protein
VVVVVVAHDLAPESIWSISDLILSLASFSSIILPMRGASSSYSIWRPPCLKLTSEPRNGALASTERVAKVSKKPPLGNVLAPH